MRQPFNRHNILPRLRHKSQSLIAMWLDIAQRSPTFCRLLNHLARDFRPEQNSYRPPKQEIETGREQLTAILHQNLIPFWYPRCLDQQWGGYLLHHDQYSQWRGPILKTVSSQARLAWFFARLSGRGYGSQYLEAAKQGLDFLYQYMWDDNYGGFYWAVDAQGQQILRPNKHSYGQIYVLYALTEYGLATGDPTIKQRAHDLFHFIDSKSHDATYGGYREAHTRDWSPVPLGAMNYQEKQRHLKSFNTHIHFLETLTPYYQFSGDPLARERLIELMFIQSNAVLRKTEGVCTNLHTADWQPQPPNQLVDYGHDVENVWLLLDACWAINLSPFILTDLFQTLFSYCIRFGYDERDGGFFFHGPLGQKAMNRQKEEWVQAEGLLGALKMFQFSGQPIYWNIFYKTLQWVYRHQVDWQYGGWHTRVYEDGRTAGDKANADRAGYHINRATLDCLEILQGLDK